jgi:xylulokinase
LENKYTYDELNELASKIEIGAEGLFCFPFGNGAERVLKNQDVKAHLTGINFNIHQKGHLIRAAQEGIAFSFRYGFDVMKSIGMKFEVIKAGHSNLFQSKIFREAFVNTCNINLEIYNTDGSQGAARGAGMGIEYYSSNDDEFKGLKVIDKLSPNNDLVKKYDSVYQLWKKDLLKIT